MVRSIEGTEYWTTSAQFNCGASDDLQSSDAPTLHTYNSNVVLL